MSHNLCGKPTASCQAVCALYRLCLPILTCCCPLACSYASHTQWSWHQSVSLVTPTHMEMLLPRFCSCAGRGKRLLWAIWAPLVLHCPSRQM